jgi:nitroimidazol reductase NimA-like FMN-containing flavoprotein (pyridoxamine 5'-phosphate oxidase superfamily)
MIRTLEDGVEMCVTITLVDGLVLARSAFHHSINYRSVVILGRARLIDDPAEKLEALRLFTEHVVHGRWDEVRPPTSQELKATTVLAMALDESSAKIRTGPPIDDVADFDHPVWAGVIPLTVVAGEPVSAEGILRTVAPFDRRRLE